MKASKAKRRARHAVKEHLPKWMLECAANANEVLAASPYVTDARLFNGCGAKVARLYTDFSTLNFIAGASSLRVLKKLLNDGVAIYHVAFLHAKTVLVDGEHFSLGSQNLTVRGRRKNVEANFVGGSDTPTKEVQSFFDRLHEDARPVSMPDILEMEKLIGPLIRNFKDIERASAGVDHDVELARHAREEAERAKRAEEARARQEAEKRAKAERSAQMKRALSRNKHFFDQSKTTTANHLMASVQKLTRTSISLDFHFMGDGTTDSLVPVDRNRTFEWLLRAVGRWPQRLSRYLLINEEDGKLGFVRYAKTRWTFFESGVGPQEQVKVGGLTWSVGIAFDWTHETTMQRNGVAALKLSDHLAESKGKVSIGFAFSVNGVELEDPVISDTEKPRMLGSAWRRRDVQATEALLKDYLVRHLTKPFKFKEKLAGRQAFAFFGHRHPVTYRIQAHRFEDTAIFSARRSSLHLE